MRLRPEIMTEAKVSTKILASPRNIVLGLNILGFGRGQNFGLEAKEIRKINIMPNVHTAFYRAKVHL